MTALSTLFHEVARLVDERDDLRERLLSFQREAAEIEIAHSQELAAATAEANRRVNAAIEQERDFIAWCIGMAYQSEFGRTILAQIDRMRREKEAREDRTLLVSPTSRQAEAGP